ncbi:uncharacterized protein [Dysidea avara]|uniref:uncharacterized protein n=1 Tax=Dysidea avara TaxID=196820 RepID=UPI0033334811
MRYDFQCYEGTTLIRTMSANISNVAHHACSSCQFDLSDPCVNECSDQCGSCDHPYNCTSCRYLVNHTNHNDCLDNTSCAMLGFEVGETGCECPVGHYLQPTETESQCLQPNNESQYLLPNREIAYRCVNQCNYTSTRVDGDDFCYACGIEKCIECTEDENGEDECVCCIEGYSPYHNHESISECIPLIEKQTKQLEEMEEEEENERENADLLLLILLPLCCMLTLLLFVGMSVFAHFYFPYIDRKGEKRHKREPLLLKEHTAWEPRPNILYR